MTDETETETQDLGISKLAMPDRNWSRTQPMFIAPSPDRLRRPWQLVSIKNTSDVTMTAQGRPVPQKHIVLDRHNFGHELEPGETKQNIEMLAHDIEYYIRERGPGRVNHMNQPKPKHPILIVGVDDSRLREQMDKEARIAERAQKERMKRDGLLLEEDEPPHSAATAAKQPGPQKKET
jgi:hypothetical protein